MDDRLAYETISAVSKRFRTGESGPVAYAEALLARIEALDPLLRAFIRVLPERALAQARAAESALKSGADAGPLTGIPYAAKDLFDVKGVPTTAGTHLLANNVAAQDCAVVRKLTAAGMALLGKTYTVQFAYGASGINHDQGTPHNPWHPVPHAPGGSSSGSAVAVAAGLAPMALGSDTGGSVRVPAALCGVLGFKPTYGRLSRAGVVPLAWSFDHVGVLARTVRELATAFDALQGAEPRDAACTDLPPAHCVPRLETGLAGLRVAVLDGHFASGAEPAALAAVDKVAAALGAQRRIDVPDSGRAVAASLLATSAEGASLNLDNIRSRAREFDPHTRDRWVAASLIPSAWYQTAQRFRRRYRAQFADAMAEFDLLIAPTTPFAAPLLGQSRIAVGGVEVPVRGHLGRFTAPISFIGLPALSVPVHEAGSLPLGVQLIARPHEDATVLRAAFHLERTGVIAHG
jgi:aspartyl-tRNA(Asn)/glutamyl-tRNA(Gln) amidotransferase subunit A